MVYDFLKTKGSSAKLTEAVNMIGGICSDIEMIDKRQEFQLLSVKLSKELDTSEVIMGSKNRMGSLFIK